LRLETDVGETATMGYFWTAGQGNIHQAERTLSLILSLPKPYRARLNNGDHFLPIRITSHQSISFRDKKHEDGS
jgi:hypothetical protein